MKGTIIQYVISLYVEEIHLASPVTTELRPVFPPAKMTIIDSTKTAWVVTPAKLPMHDMSGTAQAIRANLMCEAFEAAQHRGGEGAGDGADCSLETEVAKKEFIKVRPETTLGTGRVNVIVYYKCWLEETVIVFFSIA